MPPSAATRQPGALVWCKLKGFIELWAGQVVDPAKATPDVLALRQPDTFLVSFFPDSRWQWVPPDKIFDFEEHYDRCSQQKAAKGKRLWKQGVEEAKDLLDKRNRKAVKQDSADASGKKESPQQLSARRQTGAKAPRPDSCSPSTTQGKPAGTTRHQADAAAPASSNRPAASTGAASKLHPTPLAAAATRKPAPGGLSGSRATLLQAADKQQPRPGVGRPRRRQLADGTNVSPESEANKAMQTAAPEGSVQPRRPAAPAATAPTATAPAADPAKATAVASAALRKPGPAPAPGGVSLEMPPPPEPDKGAPAVAAAGTAALASAVAGAEAIDDDRHAWHADLVSPGASPASGRPRRLPAPAALESNTFNVSYARFPSLKPSTRSAHAARLIARQFEGASGLPTGGSPAAALFDELPKAGPAWGRPASVRGTAEGTSPSAQSPFADWPTYMKLSAPSAEEVQDVNPPAALTWLRDLAAGRRQAQLPTTHSAPTQVTAMHQLLMGADRQSRSATILALAGGVLDAGGVTAASGIAGTAQTVSPGAAPSPSPELATNKPAGTAGTATPEEIVKKMPKKTALNHITRITLPTRIGHAQALAAAQARSKLGAAPAGTTVAGLPTPAPSAACHSGLGMDPLAPAAPPEHAPVPASPPPEPLPSCPVSVVLRVNGGVLPFLCSASMHSTQVMARGTASTVYQLAGMQGALAAFVPCSKFVDGWQQLAPGLLLMGLTIPDTHAARTPQPPMGTRAALAAASTAAAATSAGSKAHAAHSEGTATAGAVPSPSESLGPSPGSAGAPAKTLLLNPKPRIVFRKSMVPGGGGAAGDAKRIKLLHVKAGAQGQGSAGHDDDSADSDEGSGSGRAGLGRGKGKGKLNLLLQRTKLARQVSLSSSQSLPKQLPPSRTAPSTQKASAPSGSCAQPYLQYDPTQPHVGQSGGGIQRPGSAAAGIKRTRQEGGAGNVGGAGSLTLPVIPGWEDGEARQLMKRQHMGGAAGLQAGAGGGAGATRKRGGRSSKGRGARGLHGHSSSDEDWQQEEEEEEEEDMSDDEDEEWSEEHAGGSSVALARVGAAWRERTNAAARRRAGSSGGGRHGAGGHHAHHGHHHHHHQSGAGTGASAADLVRYNSAGPGYGATTQYEGPEFFEYAGPLHPAFLEAVAADASAELAAGKHTQQCPQDGAGGARSGWPSCQEGISGCRTAGAAQQGVPGTGQLRPAGIVTRAEQILLELRMDSDEEETTVVRGIGARGSHSGDAGVTALGQPLQGSAPAIAAPGTLGLNLSLNPSEGCSTLLRAQLWEALLQGQGQGVGAVGRQQNSDGGTVGSPALRQVPPPHLGSLMIPHLYMQPGRQGIGSTEMGPGMLRQAGQQQPLWAAGSCGEAGVTGQLTMLPDGRQVPCGSYHEQVAAVAGHISNVVRASAHISADTKELLADICSDIMHVAATLDVHCTGSLEVVRYANELLNVVAAQEAVLPSLLHTTLSSSTAWLMQIG